MSKARIARRRLMYGSCSEEEMVQTTAGLIERRKHVSTEKLITPIVKPETTQESEYPDLCGEVIKEFNAPYYSLRKAIYRKCNRIVDCPDCDMSYINWFGRCKPTKFCCHTRFVRWETRDEFDHRQKPSIQRYLDIETSLMEDFATL